LNSKIPEYQPPSPYTPFLRRFTDEAARDLSDTRALYDEVRSQYRASPWGQPDTLQRVHAYLAGQVAEAVEMPDNRRLLDALDRCQQQVLQLEKTIFTGVEIAWDVAQLSLKEQVDLRRYLRAQQHFLSNAERIGTLLGDAVAGIFAGLIGELPRLADDVVDDTLSVPLVALMRDPGDVIQRLINTLAKPELSEAGLFIDLQDRFYRNICAASGIDPDDDKPRRPFVMADESDLAPAELAETYLRGTPFRELFLTPVPFVLPDAVRFEHTHIIAGSGHGKTQLLQHLILRDLQRDDPPALIVIDSQGEMLRKIQSLALFAAQPERLIVIDPEQYSPALNMFDAANSRAGRYSELHREQLQAGVIELYNYIFAAIAAEMTSRQSTAFAFVARLMLAILGSTIHTLRELMEDGASSIEQSPFRDAIATLEPTAQAYFRNQFFTKRYADLKQQIARRLYGVLSVPAFDRMFSAPHNSLDMFAAMQAGKVVLVNTSKALLKSDASALFGRFMIALVIRAVYERVASPDRHPAFLIVDEASEYFDDNIQLLLEQARKFNVGLVLAHQHLDQLSGGLRSAIAANTAIKLAGGVNDRDARALAPDMRTTAEFISGMRKERNGTQFACHVRNLTDGALQLSVPFGSLEARPRMDAAAQAALIRRNRERYAAPRSTSAPGSDRDTPTPAATSRDTPTPDTSVSDSNDWRS